MSTQKLRPLQSDQTAVHTTTVEGQKVTTTFTVRPSKNEPQYNLKWTMDYATCTEEQILRLANRTMVIAQQSTWRGSKDRLDGGKWNEVEFNVAELLASERKAADPVTRAARAVDKLTKEEREKLLREEAAKLGIKLG